MAASRRVLSIFMACILVFSRGLLAQDEVEEDGEEIDVEETDAPSSLESVITLAQENFTLIVEDKRIILVEFYAPWCGHCKQLAPEYEAAAEVLAKEDIPLAKVDATENQELAAKYEVQGYPTMKIFRKGTAYDYEGPRKKDGIVTYMRDQARPDWKPPPNRVVVLTKDNFTETIEGNPLVLVEFYAPWCGHCKRLEPEYKKAASFLYDRGAEVILAKVDATAETELASQYEVTGYPTLKVFRRGRVSDYKGERQSRGIAEYMYKQSLPPSTPLTSTNEVSRFIKYPMPVIVGFFESEEDPVFMEYSDAANEAREMNLLWLHCTDPELAKVYKIEFGTVAIFMPKDYYNKHEKKIKIYSGPFGIPTEELMNNLRRMARPLVGLRTKDSIKNIYSDFPVFVGYYSSEDEEDSFLYWKEKLLLPLAVKFPDIHFAMSDEAKFKDELQSLQLDDRGDDLLIGILDENNKRYAYQDDDVSLDAVEEFIEAFQSGEIKPSKKSQPVPAKQTGPVKVVVGETFKQIVEDPEKDVLIEFYAPWCGHCKALEPIYASLAKKFKKNDKLVIAKIDATANEFPEHYQVSGFPTIYFVPAGEKPVPILFEGERDVKKMSKFLKKHATFSLGESKKKKSKDKKDEL